MVNILMSDILMDIHSDKYKNDKKWYKGLRKSINSNSELKIIYNYTTKKFMDDKDAIYNKFSKARDMIKDMQDFSLGIEIVRYGEFRNADKYITMIEDNILEPDKHPSDILHSIDRDIEMLGKIGKAELKDRIDVIVKDMYSIDDHMVGRELADISKLFQL